MWLRCFLWIAAAGSSALSYGSSEYSASQREIFISDSWKQEGKERLSCNNGSSFKIQAAAFHSTWYAVEESLPLCFTCSLRQDEWLPFVYQQTGFLLFTGKPDIWVGFLLLGCESLSCRTSQSTLVLNPQSYRCSSSGWFCDPQFMLGWKEDELGWAFQWLNCTDKNCTWTTSYGWIMWSQLALLLLLYFCLALVYAYH